MESVGGGRQWGTVVQLLVLIYRRLRGLISAAVMRLAAELLPFQERALRVLTHTLFDLAHLNMHSARVGANRGGIVMTGHAVSPGAGGGSRGKTGLQVWWDLSFLLVRHRDGVSGGRDVGQVSQVPHAGVGEPRRSGIPGTSCWWWGADSSRRD